MSFTAYLQEADKASRIALSLFKVDTIDDIDDDTVWESCDDVENSCNKLNRGSSDYLDYIAIRDSILQEGNSDIEWVRPVVDRLNLSVFTNAVWSNDERYDEAISIFFPLLVPKQLYDRDDVIEMFLNMVTRRELLKASWPTDKHTMQRVVNSMKEKIEADMEDEDEWLYQRVLDAFNKRYEHVDTIPLDDLEYMSHPRRVKESWFKLLPVILNAIGNKVDSQQAKGSGSDNDSDDDDNGSNAESEDGQDDDFYDAPTYFGDDGDREGDRFESMEDELDELEDEHDTPDEPHTGTKRSHNQADDGDPVDKRKRREPLVISASSVNQQSQESLRDHEGENNDASGAWGEDNGFNREDDYRDDTPLSGDYSAPAPPYARRSTSYTPTESVPHLDENASCTFTGSDPHFKPEETSDTRQHSDNRMENENASSQSERLPYGLPNTTNIGPSSPIPPDDQPTSRSTANDGPPSPIPPDDQPTSINLEYHTRRIGERSDIARVGSSRGRNPLLMSNIDNAQRRDDHTSSTQQQDDQITNQSSTSVTAGPSTQRRRHHRRELPDSEGDIATAPVPLQQNSERLRKLNEYWTDEEVAALDEGLRRYSRRWIAIKRGFPDVLGNRTNVQLKDKARNIARQRRKDGLPLEHYEGCG